MNKTIFITGLFILYASFCSSQQSRFRINGEDYHSIAELRDVQLYKVKELQLTMLESSTALLDSILLKISDVQNLSISSDSLQHLGSILDRLEKLQYLNVFCRNLKNLPPNIGALKCLQGLEIDCPLLNELPGSISGLDSLKFLTIHHANFSEFPNEIIMLKNGLFTLDIDISRLTILPNNFSQLKLNRPEKDLSMGYITLRNCNHLQSLPANMRSLPFEVFLQGAKSLKDISSYNSGDKTARLMIADLHNRSQVKQLLRSLKNVKNLSLTIDTDFLIPFPRALKKLNGLESLHLLMEMRTIDDKKVVSLKRKMPDTQVIVD